MLTVTNEATRETFKTRDLRKAQAYRDVHEFGLVTILGTAGNLIGESAGRHRVREAAKGRTVVLSSGYTAGQIAHVQKARYEIW